MEGFKQPQHPALFYEPMMHSHPLKCAKPGFFDGVERDAHRPGIAKVAGLRCW